ncbi:MAG: asparagine synthase (glutamine-hydrolyzing) [Pseudomonadota bacterium]
MCGICGVWHVKSAEAKVRTMCSQMVHRGPDGEGIWSDDIVALGHRRLAIVDLSEDGRQPMVCSDGRLIATVNGEIYNYPELRKVLEANGTRFTSNCDSEVVLHAYALWGTRAFHRLNGMFAFALYDAADKRLFLVRDRLGIKPLYVFKTDDSGIMFASDVRALLVATGKRNWSIDSVGLDQYLTFQNVIGTKTLFEGVSMVAPGHYMEIGEGVPPRSTSYWSAATGSDACRGFDETVEAFRGEFGAAVRRHLMSDVPVSSYLSAGFDSTMVTSVAAQHMAEPPHTFNGGFEEGGWYNEATGAQLVAENVAAPFTSVGIGADDFVRSFDDCIFALEQPRMGMGAFPQYLVASKAAETHKIILTGHGGDELFSGYPVFKLPQLLGAMRRPEQLARTLTSVRPSEVPHLAYFCGQQMFASEEHRFLPELFGDRLRASALHQSLRDALVTTRDNSGLKGLTGGPSQSDDTYRRILLTYLNVYLPGLLVVEDKISMAHSLESRTPYLDNELVDFALKLPPDVKLNGGRLKAIVKQAGRGVLPRDLYDMPKRGFPTPLRFWLRGPLRDWMETRIAGPNTTLARLFQRSFLTQTFHGYQSSIGRRVRPLDEIPTQRMWMLLSLESWMRQFDEKLGIRLEAPAG